MPFPTGWEIDPGEDPQKRTDKWWTVIFLDPSHPTRAQPPPVSPEAGKGGEGAKGAKSRAQGAPVTFPSVPLLPSGRREPPLRGRLEAAWWQGRGRGAART